ncbi:hypothetical protein QR680_017183 [Steinernema hermaphroditum]|uniref:THAP-type domain-containing protein n=1 Tax=Steinernema hermaphroditum TaxID=289476 RepID=A0AA39HET2_9BILA|nr:hypothetical protein QR680_017183 [Steinernema hermaphroditum]
MPRGHRKVPPSGEAIIVDGAVEEYVLLEDGVIEDEEGARFEAIIDDIDGQTIFQEGNVVLEASHDVGRPTTLIADHHVRSCCIVCHRAPSSSIRLFRWPRDREVRKNWCQIFGLPAESADSTDAYICSWHFAPDQFICYGEKIFWAPNARPSFVLERNFHGDFVYPWQPGYVSSGDRPSGPIRSQMDPKGLKRKNRPPPPGIQVFFRDSNYKVKGKQTHPVAILPIPTNPEQFYEFSLNRKSSDGTGFYSCLSCRKAKVETRQKDIVRTIHLTAPEPHVKVLLLSKGDPFSGHHFGCSPLTIAHEEVEHAPLETPSTSQTRSLYTIAHDASGEDEHFEGHQLWEEAVINELGEVITATNQALTYVVEGDQQVVFANSNGDASESPHNPTFYAVETASGEQQAFFRPLRRFQASRGPGVGTPPAGARERTEEVQVLQEEALLRRRESKKERVQRVCEETGEKRRAYQ